jgi:ABC-type transport system substrate-binding protein
MKRTALWMILTYLVVTILAIVSCTSSTTTPTSTLTQTKTSTTTITSTASKTTTATTTQVTTSTAQATGNWWDKLGKPQYGGEMVFRLNKDIVNWDPYNLQTLTAIESAWMEKLNTDDWTKDPAVWDYGILYRGDENTKGLLGKSWEFSEPGTFVVHLRQGIHWQNISPVNGREFIADDVAAHYNRLYGLGGGYTKPSPYQAATVAWQSLKSVTATDKYTVAFKWNSTNPEFILDTMWGLSTANDIEAPDAVKLWGDVNDWHHAIGTGPFILKDFVSSSSATMTKNPDYWGYDERYPQNKLPYVNTVKMLVIPDPATAMAGLRTGKIDVLDGLQIQQVTSLNKTNPELLQITIPRLTGLSVDPRNDKAPFTDIRVRKAMQMSIDLKTISSTYYEGYTEANPSQLTSTFETGWGYPYDQWPQDLKDEYAYNPTAAKKLLADAGFPGGFKTNVVVDNTADLDLLQIVKSYFAAVGINMDIKPMDAVAWNAYVRRDHLHDQIAMRASGSLGCTFAPLRQLLRFQTGYSTDWAMVSDPVFDAYYNTASAATSIDTVQKILKDANERAARQHWVVALLHPNDFAL